MTGSGKCIRNSRRDVPSAERKRSGFTQAPKLGKVLSDISDVQNAVKPLAGRRKNERKKGFLFVFEAPLT
ncbi:hypothetical protein LCGC14_1089260, partial [marine sediment metagenome]